MNKQFFARFFKPQILIIVLLIWSAAIRLWRIDYPREYVFDEVYHAFTAKMYALERYEGWVWWTSPPEGVAYEWTHPPLAKVIMSWGISAIGGAGEVPTKITDPTKESAFTEEERNVEKASTRILANNSAGWRVPGALFGILCTYGLYLLGSLWFRNRWVGVLAAFLFCVDLLPLVQSRTAMNDIYTVTFLVYGFYFFTKRGIGNSFQFSVLLSSYLPLPYWLLSGVMLGCAIASKWTALFSLGIVAFYHVMTLVIEVVRSEKGKDYVHYLQRVLVDAVKGIVCFALIPFGIYLLSYWQLFTLPINDYQGNSLVEAREAGTVPENERWIFEQLHIRNEHFANRMYIWWGLQKQMWWYHTNLVAEHNYTSKWWTWPLMIRPVWFYVNYCNSHSADPVCVAELQRWGVSSLFADIYTMGNPLLYWSFIPVFVYFAHRYLYTYRWWFSSIIVFAIVTLLRYSWSSTVFSEPTMFTSQLSTIFSSIIPPIMLFSMLVLLFVSVIEVGSRIVQRDHDGGSAMLPLVFALVCFCAFWLPWANSPRIMFYYHFFPPVTFMYVFLAGIFWELAKISQNMRRYVGIYLCLVALCFVYFYPHVTAFLLPEGIRSQYWWFKSWQ